MLATLTLAAALIPPCPAIPPKHHKAHHASPAQSCVATLPPRESVLCIRETPEPDIEPMPQVYTYYTTSLYGEPSEALDVPTGNTDLPIVPAVWVIPSGGGSTYIAPHSPPGFARAPEIDSKGCGAALTLLLGALATIRARLAQRRERRKNLSVAMCGNVQTGVVERVK